MNAQSQLYRLPVYRSQWLSVFAFVAAILGSALGADAQRLTPSPFAFPPSSQVSLPAQARNTLMGFCLLRGRSQERAVVKIISQKPSTKAQLNQVLITEAHRHHAAYVAGLLARGADPNASDKAGVPVLFCRMGRWRTWQTATADCQPRRAVTSSQRSVSKRTCQANALPLRS